MNTNSSKIQVTYLNKTEHYQVLRIANLCCYVERVVAPHQELVFKALADSILEVYTTDFITAMIAEKILISEL